MMKKKCVGIFVNLRKKNVHEVLKTFFDCAQKSTHRYLIDASVKNIGLNLPSCVELVSETILFKSCDLIVAFGGDGTILLAAHRIGEAQIPILGVNLGGLGFLTASSVNKAVDYTSQFLSGKLSCEERSLLELGIESDAHAKHALNDIVIDKAGFSRVIRIITRLNGKLLNSYIADGLIISTPTGSTAYSLANGGPIVIPSTPAFIINPICPHTLTNRPVVIADTTVITLQVQSELGKFSIFSDGIDLGFYPTETVLTIKKAPFHTYLVEVPQNDFYITLRNKLGWGEDFRNKYRWP
jgi:NAD+ kinase